MNILIGGVGGVLLGDDGVGPYVARWLDAHYEFEPGVEVADLGTPALDLIDELSGRDAVILIDSVNVEAKPGSVLLYRKTDIMQLRPATRMDPHSPALVEALLHAELFGVGPGEVLLVGVKAESFEPNCGLSQPVRAALGQVVTEVLRELKRLQVHHEVRRTPKRLDVWWMNRPATDSGSISSTL